MLALADPDLDNGPRTDKSATMRMCAVSREVRPIDELIRFVVSPSGEVMPDLKRKLPGRLGGALRLKVAFPQSGGQWFAVAINLPSPWRMRAGLGHHKRVSVSLGRRHRERIRRPRELLVWSGDAYLVRSSAATPRQCSRRARAVAVHSFARARGIRVPERPSALAGLPTRSGVGCGALCLHLAGACSHLPLGRSRLSRRGHVRPSYAPRRGW